MKYLSAFCLILFSIVSPTVALTQTVSNEIIFLEGEVVDATNDEPLPFASIILEGESKGGTTNENGRFTFKIPSEFGNDTLKISYMGYESYRNSIRNLRGRKIKIALNPATVYLDEAVVKPWNAENILKEAIANIPQNYLDTTASITYFYRGKTQSNKEHIEYAEGVFQLIKKAEGGENHLAFLKGRQLICKPIFEQMGIDLTLKGNYFLQSDIVHHLDEVELLNKDGLKNHDFWVDKITYIDSLEVYEIHFDQNKRKKKKALYQGKIFVDTKDKAIVRIEFGLSALGLENAKVWKGKNKIAAYFMGINAEYRQAFRRTDYRKHKGKWVLDKSIHKFAYLYNRSSPAIESLLEIEAEYLVTDIDTENIQISEGKEQIKDKQNALTSFESFDGNFWKHYNIIAESEDTKRILKEISEMNEIYQLKEEE